jgi:hypothetical protein
VGFPVGGKREALIHQFSAQVRYFPMLMLLSRLRRSISGHR